MHYIFVVVVALDWCPLWTSDLLVAVVGRCPFWTDDVKAGLTVNPIGHLYAVSFPTQLTET